MGVNSVALVLVGQQDLVTPKGHMSPHNKPNRSHHHSQKDLVASAHERGLSCDCDSEKRTRSDLNGSQYIRIRVLFQKAKK